MGKIKQVNIVFLIIVVLPSLVGLALPSAWLGNDLVVLLFSQVMYAIPALAYIVMNRLNIRESFRIHKIKGSSVLLLVLFAYAITPVMGFISAASQLFGKNEISSSVTSISEQFPMWVGVLCIAVIPAILEEVVYRGVFFCEYSKRNKRAAIVLSAFLFGVLHQNLNQFSYAFVMGIIFALVIEATDSIVSTMIIHFVINATSVISVYLYPQMVRSLEAQDTTGTINADALIDEMVNGVTDKVVIAQTVLSYAIPALIGLVIAVIIFRCIAKKENRMEEVKAIFTLEEKPEVGFTQLITIPLLLGIGLCLLSIIYLLVA